MKQILKSKTVISRPQGASKKKLTVTYIEQTENKVKFFKEPRQAQCVHAARDDRRGGPHSLPFLVIERAIGAVAFDHVGNIAVIGFAFHLAMAHRAHVDARGALQA